MEKLGFTYNMNTCVGCGACQIACKSANGLLPEENFRRVQTLVYGPYSGSCNHCRDAGCVKACPTGAMYKAEDGTTLHDDGRCIGCGACLWNCPYGAISFSKSKGITQKCTTCQDRREKGENPACVNACPTRSISFGVIDEPKADLPFLPDSGITGPNLIVFPSKRLVSMREVSLAAELGAELGEGVASGGTKERALGAELEPESEASASPEGSQE